MKRKNSLERFLFCLFISAVFIPAIILSGFAVYRNYKVLGSETVEEKYTYAGVEYGMKLTPDMIILHDDFGNESEIAFNSFSSKTEDAFFNEIKNGDEVYASVSSVDKNELVGIRTRDKIYYDAELNKKERTATVIALIFVIVICLALEITFLIGSKKIFKEERITKRTDRPVTEDMFKDSFWG